MKVIVMGFGRVGSELTSQLVEGGHEVVVIDKNPGAFIKYPPAANVRNLRRPRVRQRCARGGRDQGDGGIRRRLVGRQFEHRVGACGVGALPRTQGGRSDLRPTSRGHLRAFEHPHGRHDEVGCEADPAHALPRSERGAREPRRRRPGAPSRAGATPSRGQAGGIAERRRTAPGGRRLARGGGFIPTAGSTLQEGDYLAVIMAKDGMDLLDQVLAEPDREPTDARHRDGRRRRRTAPGGRPRGSRPRRHVDRSGSPRRGEGSDWAPNVNVILGDACEPWVWRRRSSARPRSSSRRRATTRTTW